MPIYEYECLSCGHRLEAIQKISDAPLTDCPNCRKPELKKLISAAAFRLKGGGWYETDFKGGKKRNVAESGKAESGKAESGDKKDSASGSKSDGAASAGKTAETKSASSGDK